MSSEVPDLIHANALVLEDYGVLILGESGSGKSLLTLTLIERAQLIGRTAQLVADDYCELMAQDDRLMACVPKNIHGAMEIRGAGLFSYSYQERTGLDLVVELNSDAERYPEAQDFCLFGICLPRLRLPRLDGNIPLLAVCHAIEATLFQPRWSENRVSARENP